MPPVWSPSPSASVNTLLCSAVWLHMVFCAQSNWQLHFLPLVTFSVYKVNPWFVLQFLLMNTDYFFFLWLWLRYFCSNIQLYMAEMHNFQKYVCAKNGSIYSALSIYLSSFISVQLAILLRLRHNRTQLISYL